MPRILIADDSHLNAELLDAHLDGSGFETKLVYNGEEALATIQAELPNLVFLDVMMPKKNGFDVCQAVKKELGLSQVHIILLTAKGQEFDRLRGEEVGANMYMTKPFDPDALMAQARAVLGL